MAQQIQGGGITFDEGAGVRQNAALLNQSLSGLSDVLLRKRQQAMELFGAAQKQFMDEATAAGVSPQAYATLQPKKYETLLGLQNATKSLFSRDSKAELQGQADQFINPNNLSADAIRELRMREAYARGITGEPAQQAAPPPANAPQTGAVPTGTLTAVPTSGMATPPVPARSAITVASERNIKPNPLTDWTGNPTGEVEYVAVDPVTKQSIGKYKTNQEAMDALGSHIQRGMSNPKSGQPYVNYLRSVQEEIAPGSSAALSTPMDGTQTQGTAAPTSSSVAQASVKDLAANELIPEAEIRDVVSYYNKAYGKNVHTTEAVAKMRENNRTLYREYQYAKAGATPAEAQAFARKEQTASKSSTAITTVSDKVTSGGSFSPADARKAMKAASESRNYLEGLSKLSDSELNSIVSHDKKLFEQSSSEMLQAYGFTKIADRRAAKEALETQYALQEMQTNAVIAAQNGKLSASVAESTSKMIDAMANFEGKVTEGMKQAGQKNRAEYMRLNPQLQEQENSLRKIAAELTGTKYTPFMAVDRPLWFQTQFVPGETVGGSGTGTSVATDPAYQALKNEVGLR